MSWFDDEDNEKHNKKIDMDGEDYMSEEYLLKMEDYVKNHIDHSESGVYVLFASMGEGKIMVADVGSLKFCISRMREIFDLAPVKHGLSIMTSEKFDEYMGYE